MLGHDDFDSLFRALYNPAYSIALRILGDRRDAEDAAAEAMARALASWRRLRGIDHQRAWILKVTANVAVDMIRRRRARAASDIEPVAAGSRADERLVLAAALRRLPRRQREVLVLRFLADLTEAQVAEQLCITLGSVKQHSRRGLDALRKSLDGAYREVSLAF